MLVGRGRTGRCGRGRWTSQGLDSTSVDARNGMICVSRFRWNNELIDFPERDRASVIDLRFLKFVPSLYHTQILTLRLNLCHLSHLSSSLFLRQSISSALRQSLFFVLRHFDLHIGCAGVLSNVVFRIILR